MDNEKQYEDTLRLDGSSDDDAPKLAPDAPPAQQAPSEEVDWKRVDEELKARGAGFSLKDAPKNFLDLQRGLSKTGEENKRLKSEYEPFAPLIQVLKQRPDLAEQVYGTVNQGLEGAGGSDPDTSAAVRRALDPVQRELHETRLWRIQQQLEGDFKKLQDEFKDEFEFSDDVRNEVLTDCMANTDYNIRRVFLDRYGKDMLQRAKSRGKQETVERIKERNEGYTPISGAIPVGPAEVPDFSKLSPTEQNAEVDRVIDRIWSDKKFAKSIASEVSG